MTQPRRDREQRRMLRAARLADAATVAMRGLLRPLAGAGRFAMAPLARARRLVILQIDGLSRTRLDRAMAAGYMPSLAARLARGTHVLQSTRAGVPASTPAFQAGLFYGVSPAVPGFVWFDRRTGREVRMDRAADAAEVERRVARHGPGLLRGGTSYFSILSGGAALAHFCLSGVAGDLDLEWYQRHMGAWDALASLLTHSVTTARSAARVAHEIGTGVVDGLRWSMAVGRAKHEPRFLVHRVLVGAVLREVSVQAILLDLSRGVPAVYVDFLAFDEYAHRRGPDSEAALRTLPSIDAALATIFAGADAVPELGYDVYVVSDHGHVATRPFEAIVGVSLPEYVAIAERGAPLPRGVEPGRPNRGILGGRTVGGAGADGVFTAEAGDLAHVYFLRDHGPLPLDALRARHWRVLAALSASRAVGILAVRGGRRGLALVRGDLVDLADPLDVQRLPHPQPALLAAYLADLLVLPESGDIVVLGWRGEGREVIAYAWEFGSHGGVAPEELESFVMLPAERARAFPRVLRPSDLYRFFEDAYRRADERGRPRTLRASGDEGALEAPPP